MTWHDILLYFLRNQVVWLILLRICWDIFQKLIVLLHFKARQTTNHHRHERESEVLFSFLRMKEDVEEKTTHVKQRIILSSSCDTTSLSQSRSTLLAVKRDWQIHNNRLKKEAIKELWVFQGISKKNNSTDRMIDREKQRNTCLIIWAKNFDHDYDVLLLLRKRKYFCLSLCLTGKPRRDPSSFITTSKWDVRDNREYINEWIHNEYIMHI